MRWPWQKRAEPPGVVEAQEHIDRLQRQQPEVTRLSKELQIARQRNHFAELIAAALRGAS
jgi:hypothetical protein